MKKLIILLTLAIFIPLQALAIEIRLPMGPEEKESNTSNMIYNVNVNPDPKGTPIIEKHIFLDDDIQEPSTYREILLTLYTAKSTDTIIFIINSAGGSVMGMLAIMDGIKNTKAHTVAELFVAFSAAANIALMCDDIRIHSGSYMMLHPFSGPFGEGNMPVVLERGKSFTEWSAQFFLQTAKYFLTTEEIKQLNAGKEFWINEKELRERIEKYQKLRNKNKK